MLSRDKVDVCSEASLRASREAIRPIIDQVNALPSSTPTSTKAACATRNMIGDRRAAGAAVLDADSVDDGEVRQEGLHIAADYNFGQISAEWMRNIVKEPGGEIVGEEFIPLGVSQFGRPSRTSRRRSRIG